MSLVILFLSALTSLNQANASTANQQALAEERCAYVGKIFGPHGGKLDPSLSVCFDWARVKVKDDKKVFAQNLENDLQVFGFKNILYLKKGSDVSIISGNMSQIQHIESVSLSKDGKKVAVLDKFLNAEGEAQWRVLVFNTQQNGNVVPMNVNAHELLKGVRAIYFDDKGENLQILTGKEWISYSLDQDSRSPVASQRPEPKSVRAIQKE